jgi:hypothetical protein
MPRKRSYNTPEGFTKHCDYFWSFVDKRGPDDCWLWKRTPQSEYVQYSFCGKKTYAHRVAFMLAKGPIPADKPVVMHSCDTPHCCNPNHLSAGTIGDNMRDRTAKGRVARGDVHVKAKLNALVIPSIRARLAAGETARSIAEDYGVGVHAIRNIKLGLTWRHVA